MNSVELSEDFILKYTDFMQNVLLTESFPVVIKALVMPSFDGIDIEIQSVIGFGTELVTFLRFDSEHDLKVKLRTIYLNKARRGLEGDTHNHKE